MNILQDIELVAQQISSRTERFFLSMGGISCGVISQDTSFLDQLQKRFGSAKPAGKVAYEIILILASHQEFLLDHDTQPRSPSIKRLKSGNNYIIKQVDNPFQAIVNTFSGKALVKIPRDVNSFGNFLRILYTLILANEKAILLHASAVSENGHGKVFFGPSGCGKTTVARLSRGQTLIADDLVIIKPHHERYRVYATPFWDDVADEGSDNARAELSGLYLLKKDNVNSLAPVETAQAVSELFRNVLFFSDDGKMLSRVFRTCCNLINTIPVYQLHFRPDPSFWELLSKQDQNVFQLPGDPLISPEKGR
jgi:hypothetical protein